MCAVIIGSARHNELYGIPGKDDWRGGQPGDQLQMTIPDNSGECSMQEWYLHPLGWVVARAKTEEQRNKIAQNMEYICNNPCIGYDQPRDQTLYKASKPYGFNASCVNTPCDTDCARAVRVCALYAGIDCPDFYTATEISALKSTGQFDILTDPKYTESPDYLLRGDILCTKTKGHTVVVLSDGDKAHGGKGGGNVYKATGNVYQRTGPGTEYPIIQTVPKGDTVNGSTVSGNWLQCEYKGKWGYCSLKYLTPTVEEAPAFAELSGNAYFRQSPGITGKAITVVKKGDTVKLTGQTKKVLTTTWKQCVYNGKTGWISGKYLS